MNITSSVFKSRYSDNLYWKPKIWGSRGTVSKPNAWHFRRLPFDIFKFKIYVNDTDSFTTNFKPFDTTWKNETNSKNIKSVKFDTSDPYFVSIQAAYIISCRGGISLEHLRENYSTPKIITSLARYYVYFHMSRFLRDPSKIILTNHELNMLHTTMPWRTVDKDGWIMSLMRNKDDWMSFFRPTSNGLTKKGMKLFQQAIESYVYCVLGAQARTRWSIVNGGAKSLQTQDVFKKLVEDSIAQDDVTVTISNMRQAILDTNVVLNMAISPGIILVPSDMIIIKKKIQGWNNVLTLATGDMKFGTNTKVNAPVQEDRSQPPLKKTSSPESEDLKITQNSVKSVGSLSGFGEYVVAGVVVSVVTRYVISFVV